MICIVLSCAGQGAAAQTAPSQPPLTAEVSDVAALEPAGPHRLFVLGSGPNAGADILEADSKDLNLVGVVPANHGLIEINQDASRIFVAEMFYRRENRGPREDVLAVYDGRTLNLLNEIELPGRLIVVPKMHVFDISADAKRAYIYDMMPASRVHVIDLEHGVVLKSVDLPGCALAMPYGERHFATICGDGTVGAVKVGEDGAGSAAFSAPFFKPNEDPLFESAVVDRATGYGWFLTFTGKVYPIKFGDAPEVGAPWTLSAAAGLQPVGTGVQEEAWRPGGNAQVMALHRSSGRLYVLMHVGNYWTHKQNGTEVWVFDGGQKALLRRITLEQPARSINVSQDPSPLLYALGDEGDLAVLDATSGLKLRKRKLAGSMISVPGE